MSARHTAKGNANILRRDLEALRGDIVKLTEELPSLLSEVRDDSLAAARSRVSRMKDEIDASLGRLGERGVEAARAVNEATGAVAQQLEEQVQAHPLAIIAFAVGVGCLIGATWRR